MKKIGPVLVSVAALVLWVLFVPGPQDSRHAALGAGSVITLANAATAPSYGISSITAQVTPTENGADTITFQFTSSGLGSARIEVSVDGTNWTPLYRFKSATDVFRAPVCGPCVYRANILYATASDTVTVTASLSGAGIPLATTYTPTPTATPTPT